MAQSRGKRWNPQPKAKQCEQGGREDAILTRKDKLGKNCSKFVDAAAKKAAEIAESKK
jgi:hypothetical protein